jgi:D-alanine--D-alanine ligase
MRTAEEIVRFDSTDALDEAKGFFLVGIGGAGMSGLARLLQSRGRQVLGTDAYDSPIVRELASMGIPVRIGHSGENIREGDAVVFSDAIDLKTSPEAERAAELGCSIFRRSQVLGWLLRGKKVIAVTGTHGKTTTTGLIAAGLLAAGQRPTIIIGAEVPEFGGSVVEGDSEWAVVESCEAYESYRDIDPHIAVLTNLELDHIDYHGSWENLLASMKRFLGKVPEGGAVITTHDYGAEQAITDLDVPIKIVGPEQWISRGKIPLAMPGDHSVRNAAIALEACLRTGAKLEDAAKGIAAFRGAERRLQVLREEPQVVVDDYAHHPTEIRASLQAMRERYPEKRLVVIYQPHLYSRTAGLIDEFADALSDADLVLMTDIYPAREAPMPGISSLRIVEKLTVPSLYVPSRHELARKAAELAEEGDVLISMGAGNIAELPPLLIAELDRPQSAKIAVLCGGVSAEREVSLHSGKAVAESLRRQGYDAYTVDPTEELLKSGSLSGFVGKNRPDLAVIQLHGTAGEDGAIQGALTLLGIPFSGSGVMSSAMCMDKEFTKQRLKAAGIRTPQGLVVRSSEDIRGELAGRLVVKPNAQGSTAGLTFVDDYSELPQAIETALRYDSEALIEERIEGMEISVPVIGDKALLPVEIVPASGEYDFASKYLPGGAEEICPARLPDETLSAVQALAVKVHSLMGCRGVTRTDMIITDDGPVVLEVNTVPGMTETSLVPHSAAASGMSFDELTSWMVKDAQETPQA